MPQIQVFGPSRKELMKETLGQSLGQGLSKLANTYYANKAIEGVIKDPEFKKGTTSDRMGMLETAMRMHGDEGAQIMKNRIAIEAKREQEPAYQLQMLQPKLENLRKLAKDPNATQTDLLTAVIEAGAGNEYLQRQTGSIMQAMSPGFASQDMITGLKTVTDEGKEPPVSSLTPPAPGQAPGQAPVKAPAQVPVAQEPPRVAQKEVPQDVRKYSEEYLKDLRPDLLDTESAFGQVPTFDYAAKSDLRPQEESEVRQKLQNAKVRPERQDAIIEKLREDIRTRYNEKIQNYGMSQQEQQAIDNKWKDFGKYALGGDGQTGMLTPFLDVYKQEGKNLTAGDLQGRYFQLANKLPTNLTREAMHSQVMPILLGEVAQLQALETVSSMPPIRGLSDTKEYMNTIQDAYEPLAKLGYIGALKEDAINNKDLGIEGMHEAIWGRQTSKDQLNEIHNIKAPKKLTETTASGGLLGKSTNKNYQKENDKYINDLSKSLKKMGPKDDLILQRAMVLDNGGKESDFRNALRQAQIDGLQLSPFQADQLVELNVSRQQPIWSIFSPGGMSTMFNYIRGKR